MDELERVWVQRFKDDLLDRKVEVATKDDRIFTGTIRCLDYKMNVLLTECVQTCTLPTNPPQPIQTNIGIANIPGDFIKDMRKI